jgi:hypothetical protein
VGSDGSYEMQTRARTRLDGAKLGSFTLFSH